MGEMLTDIIVGHHAETKIMCGGCRMSGAEERSSENSYVLEDHDC